MTVDQYLPVVAIKGQESEYMSVEREKGTCIRQDPDIERCRRAKRADAAELARWVGHTVYPV